MKHIKQFESKNKYKVGDYVKLDLEKIGDDSLSDAFVYIFDTQIYGFYDVLFINNKEDYHDGYEVEESEIKRRMTPKEINTYKMMKDAKKYNV